MKILVDGRCFTSRPTGVANFALNAINSIASRNISVIIIAHRRINKEVESRFISKNIQIQISSLRIFKNNGILWFLLKFPFLVRKSKPDFIWGPAHVIPFFLSNKTKKIVTIHDFVYRYFAETMSIKTRIENKLFTSYSIKNADFIWCVSQYTKNELNRLYKKRKCEDIFVGTGIDNKKFRNLLLSEDEILKILERYNMKTPFILFVGTVEPRKNLNFLISLMPNLVKDNISLLIVGNEGWGKKEFKNSDFLDCLKFIKFTGFIETDDLVKLYNVANSLISTSINEGFGLPLLEAMACGCPVIAAHNSGMIEVVEGVGTTVKGWDKNEWTEIIKCTIKNNTINTEDYEKRVRLYYWESTVDRLIPYLQVS